MSWSAMAWHFFKALFAKILEGDRQRPSCVLLNPRRYADATRLGKTFEACCDIHAVAEDVIGLDDYVAQIDANTECDLLVRDYAGTSLGDTLVDLDCTPNGLHDALEFCKKAVADCLYACPAVIGDGRHQKLAKQRSDARMRALFVRSHKAAVAGDVGDEDRG